MPPCRPLVMPRLRCGLFEVVLLAALFALLGGYSVKVTEYKVVLSHAALRDRVVSHIQKVHGELQLLVTTLCGASTRVPSPWEQQRGDVNVPSCAALHEAGLEGYYGNLNMLLVEQRVEKARLGSAVARHSSLHPGRYLLRGCSPYLA